MLTCTGRGTCAPGPTEGHLVEEIAGIVWRKRRLQWNTALNGFHSVPRRPAAVRVGPAVAQLRLSRAWIVTTVYSGHPAARNGQALQAMAMTVGGRATMSGVHGGGFVYVVSDRFALRDPEGVMLH